MQKISIAVLLMLSVSVMSQAEDVELGPFKSTAPKDWKSSAAANNMRIYQASLPKAEGDKEDADLVIFWFGNGGGGGVKENIERWKKQVAAPKGKKLEDIAKVTELKIGDKLTATYLDIPGITYLFKAQPFNPKAETTEKEDFHFLGVVVEGEKGPYFIRMTGPAKTVEKHKKAFDEWLKNFK